MKLALTAQIRNGVLWSLVEQCGTIAELARRLNYDYQTLCSWVNLRAVPQALDTSRMQALERNLVQQFGITLDEIFPEELRASRDSLNRIRRKLKGTAYAEVSISQLEGMNLLQLQAPDSLQVIEESIDSEIIRNALEEGISTLPEREQFVIRAHYGLLADDDKEYTLAEIGQMKSVSVERVRQIEARAIRKLRHPKRHARIYKIHERKNLSHRV